MKKIMIVFDDTIEVPSRIETIIGKNSYGDIVLKRSSLYNRFIDNIEKSKIKYEIYRLKNLDDINEKFINMTEGKIIFHYMSNFPINNADNFQIFLKKLEYIKDNFSIYNDKSLLGLIFTNNLEYKKFLKNYTFNKKIAELTNFEKINIEACLDISIYQNLLYYISGGFDSRYFNSISGDEFMVIKSSTDKKKIKMEYTYYNLLPDNMKKWIVMPYNYKEDKEKASYTMERMPMTDIAIRWTHGAIDSEELKMILDKAFYFINECPKKIIDSKEYKDEIKKVYLKKLEDRIKKLKECSEFSKLELLIKSGTDFNSIDDIISLYKKIYEKISIKDNKNELVIGHGDLFFANMLYSKEINMLKLIDPKGALEEKELWQHPYYDIAKLSHSICGKYDFFNVDGFTIDLNKDMKFELNINFNNQGYDNLFKEYLEKNDFDYKIVRLYEASLFLSMLPLHIDNPHKVLGFLLNAINILKELEKCIMM